MIKKLKSIETNKLIKIAKISIGLNLIFTAFFIGCINFNDAMHKKPEKIRVIEKSKMMAEHSKIKELKIALNNAMQAPEFNEQMVRDLFTKIDNQMDETRKMINDAIIAKAKTLPAEERVKLLPMHLRKKEHRCQFKK